MSIQRLVVRSTSCWNGAVFRATPLIFETIAPSFRPRVLYLCCLLCWWCHVPDTCRRSIETRRIRREECRLRSVCLEANAISGVCKNSRCIVPNFVILWKKSHYLVFRYVCNTFRKGRCTKVCSTKRFADLVYGTETKSFLMVLNWTHNRRYSTWVLHKALNL